MSQITGTTIAIVSAIIIVLCCICACLFAITFGLVAVASEPVPEFMVEEPQVIEEFVSPTATPVFAEPDLDESGTPAPVKIDTLETLENTIVPVNDLHDLAERLEGKTDIPKVIAENASTRQVGEQDRFWITNASTNNSFEVDATLEYVTDNAYFFIENGVPFRDNALRDLAEAFQNDILPINREFFGTEWSPGIDGDPHMYILYVRNAGSSIAGYYSSSDQYHPDAHEYSNGHELFVLNADTIDLREDFTYGVLAHEYQHMIHWYLDRNEETWLNEGFAEVAAFLNGYYEGGFDFVFAREPDMQLTDWPANGDTTPHYGAAFMFLAYFLDQYGEDATKALVADTNNGMSSVDEVLTSIAPTDVLRGNTQTTSLEFFQDWTLTNYLQDTRIADGRYDYVRFDDAPSFDETETVRDCPTGQESRDVHQFGADYIRITCDGTYTLQFAGSTQVSVVPAQPYSGEYAFWSNRGDESNMTLTREFDFTDETGALTLSFHTWYDIETDYDYLYLVASTDGETWDILPTIYGTDADPSGNSYGWAYNGQTNGWVNEVVDISQYAGETVSLRFEYVTDAAVNGNGFLLDDVSIIETGYFTDFETDNDGWEAAGFARIQNVLPQTFLVSLIQHRGGSDTTVEYIELDATNQANIPITIGRDVDEVTLVVSGATGFTRQKAAYRYDIQP